jgi:hypothetical protein
MGPHYMDEGDLPQMDGYAPPADAVSTTSQPYTANQNPSFWQRMQNQVKQGIQNQPVQQQPGIGNTNPSNIGSTIGKTVGGLASLFMDDGGMGADNYTGPTAVPDSMKQMFTRMMDQKESGYADDGAIFTKPTKVALNDNEAAVPLKYRPNAKTRPSMAMGLVDKIQRKDQPHQAWT